MSTPKPKDRGYVVDHKESKVRYAVSADNFNPEVHVKVRGLKQHETVRGYVPKVAPAKGSAESPKDEREYVSDDAKATHTATNTRK